jgi:hypothetical protein
LGAIKLAGVLRPAGFKLITHNDRYGAQRTKVSDPEIIADCGRTKTILLTADADLESTYTAEITSARIAVFILGNNHDGPDKWGPRIILAKSEIEEQLGKRRKPFVARINCAGHITQVRMCYKKKTKVIRIGRKKTKKT